MTTVRVANLPVVATMVINVAAQEGFFEDHGLDVQVTESNDLSTFIPALGSQYDVVMTTPSDFLNAATRGFDILATAGGWGDYIAVVSPSASSIEELAGKKIATNALAGIQYALLQDSLQQNGVEGFTLEAVPFAQQLDQLDAGAVDAVTVGEPFLSTALADPANQEVFVPRFEATGRTDTLTSWFSTTHAFRDEHPEAVQGFADALVDAIAWIAANEDDFRALLQRDLGLSEEIATTVRLPEYKDVIAADDLTVYVGPLVRQGQLDAAAEDLDLSTFVL